MRSMWKGSVSFGLVSIPVKMYLATEQHDVSFRQVRASDGSRVRYRRVAETDGEEVPYREIAKGYELPDGRLVVLTDEDLSELPLPSKKVIDVLEFVPLDQVDPIYFNKSYYLEPEATGATKPYVLLRDVLEESEMVAVVKVAFTNREHLATLRVRDGVLVLSTMMWPDEIRTPSFGFLDEDVDLRPQELSMAQSLVSSMASEFDPSEFTDDYAEALERLVDAKIEGAGVVSSAPAEDEDDNVVDLMAALRASIDKSKGGDDGESRPKKKAGRKPASKKQPAKKSADSKSTAKKSTAKKQPAKKSAAKKSTTKKSTSKRQPAKKAAS